MCGIFGVIGNSPDRRDIFRELLLANRDRGRDSAGVFNGRVSTKTNHDGLWLLPALDSEFCDSNILLGHTRNSTSGAHTIENAHPYSYNGATVAHNGVLSEWRELARKEGLNLDVDSQVMAWMIGHRGVRSVKEFEGSIAAWAHFMNRPDCVFLFRNDRNPLFYGYISEGMVFSSEERVINTVTPRAKARQVPPNTLFRVNVNTLKTRQKHMQVGKEKKEVIGFERWNDSEYMTRGRFGDPRISKHVFGHQPSSLSSSSLQSLRNITPVVESETLRKPLRELNGVTIEEIERQERFALEEYGLSFEGYYQCDYCTETFRLDQTHELDTETMTACCPVCNQLIDLLKDLVLRNGMMDGDFEFGEAGA